MDRRPPHGNPEGRRVSPRLVKLLAMYLFATAVATWAGPLPGSTGFLLGVGFGVFVIRPVLRWADQ
jgi:hypothetical protein